MSRLHLHKCDRCKKPFACGGDWLRNHNGFPEVACEFFHVEGSKHPIFRQCEDCAMTSFCANCGDHPATVELDGDALCGTCADERVAEELPAPLSEAERAQGWHEHRTDRRERAKERV